MIIIFGYIVGFVIIASQFYRLKKFATVIKEIESEEHQLEYQESSWLWYGSQAILAIISLIINITSTDSTNKAVFIVLTAMFLANVILGVTFKRIYYNHSGFVYQQRFIHFNRVISIEKLNTSSRTYAISLDNDEVLYMEKRRALFIEGIYHMYKK